MERLSESHTTLNPKALDRRAVQITIHYHPVAIGIFAAS
jgi:hypothetical protein